MFDIRWVAMKVAPYGPINDTKFFATCNLDFSVSFYSDSLTISPRVYHLQMLLNKKFLCSLIADAHSKCALVLNTFFSLHMSNLFKFFGIQKPFEKDVSVLHSSKSLFDILLLAKKQDDYCLGLFPKCFIYSYLNAKKAGFTSVFNSIIPTPLLDVPLFPFLTLRFRLLLAAWVHWVSYANKFQVLYEAWPWFCVSFTPTNSCGF